MKVNGQPSVKSLKSAGGAKKARQQETQGFADRVEVGGPSSNSINGARKNGKPGGNHGANQKHWKEHSQNGSINAAGQAGLPGAIAAANLHYPDGRWNLKALADKAMVEADLAIEYPADVKKQVADIMARIRPAPGVYNLPEVAKAPWVRDLRNEHFISIDNGTLWTKMDPAELAKNPEANVTSKDLDQLQGMPIKHPNGDITMRIAVSDLNAFVPKDSPLDKFMDVNGSSVYTADKIYNLIPKELAEDVISLNPREDRFATIIEYTVAPDGSIKDESVYQAIVNSRAKLDYASVGAWIDGKAEPSPAMKQDDQILESIKLQDEASQRLKKYRSEHGALDFESSEVKITTNKQGDAVGFEVGEKNRATELVENCMVTSNQVMSRFLRKNGMATLERVVVPPEKWDQIQQLASEHGGRLPNQPDGVALRKFLDDQRAKDPDGYQDLSFSVIKLIGRGEYQAVGPNENPPGHFGLGITNYSQCTASIRRGGDRIAARQLNSVLSGKPSQYEAGELNQFAENITKKESVTKKVERQIEKSVIATMLEKRIGEQFDAVVSGVKGDKVWIKISQPPVEGSLQGQGGGAKVGQKVHVQLKSVNVEKGFIDFVRA
ncbi:MAG: RNB domain-containing ribonuclease [Vulcanimicrobiota bacterium]